MEYSLRFGFEDSDAQKNKVRYVLVPRPRLGPSELGPNTNEAMRVGLLGSSDLE
jgi:hypothetical protein